MDVGTASMLGGMAAAFVLGFLNLWDKAREAKTRADAAATTVAEVKTEQTVANTRISGHDVALNGGLTERVQGIVAHQLLLAGIVTPGPAGTSPAPAGGQGADAVKAARIAQLRAALAIAEGEAHAA